MQIDANNSVAHGLNFSGDVVIWRDIVVIVLLKLEVMGNPSHNI